MRHSIAVCIESAAPRKISPFDDEPGLIVKTGIAEAIHQQLGGPCGMRSICGLFIGSFRFNIVGPRRLPGMLHELFHKDFKLVFVERGDIFFDAEIV
jgi:hypothetical protein